MSSYKRILTVQDISCFGQCSITVALPVISACGIETSIIPSSVLSTHTGGFTGYTFRDLTEDIPAIQKHWQKQGIKFDAVYTGYLGNTKQIDCVKEIMKTLGKDGSINIVDPVMADNGELYPGFDKNYVNAMKRLCEAADVIIPNITEACFLTDTGYKTEYDETYIKNLIEKLKTFGAKTIVLTGVSYEKDKTGVMVFENGQNFYYEHKKISEGCHGTGDVYSSAFVGALINGKTPIDAARIAADYTLRCIEYTHGDESHWYGVKFEPLLPELIAAVRN